MAEVTNFSFPQNIITFTFQSSLFHTFKSLFLFSFPSALYTTPTTICVWIGSQNGKSSWKIFAGCNEAPQLQPVPVLIRKCYSSQDAHAETFGRKTFQVQSMLLLLHNRGLPQDTLADPFGWEAFQLCAVRLLLHNSQLPQDTLEDSLRGKAF